MPFTLVHTEDRSRCNEQDLADFFDNATVGLHWVGPDGIILRANRYELTLLGYSPDEYIGHHIAEFHADEKAISDILQRLLAGQELQNYEARLRCKDGSIRYVLISANVLWEDGKFVHARCFTRDITDRKLVEDQLRASEARLTSILRQSPAGIVQTDAAGRMTLVNDFWCKMLGYAEAELLGKSVFEVTHSTSVATTTKAVQHLASGGADYQIETTYQCADGSLIMAQSNLAAMRSPTGDFLGLIAVVMDITAKKQTEEFKARLAAIFESSDDAIISKDLQGTITSWNRGAELVFGYTAKEIVGQSILRLIPTERHAEEHEILARVASGESVRHFETVRLRKDGGSVELSVMVSPIKDATGTIIGASKIGRDISERKLVEAALRQNVSLFSTLIDQAPMGTYVVDSQFRLQQVNAEAMHAFTAVQPLIGRDFNEVLDILWGPVVGAQCADIFRHTLSTGERYVSPPFTQKRRDLGIEQTYEWEIQRVTLPDGQYGVVCYFHEITERARATEALRASQERMHLATEATGVGIWEWNVLTDTIRWDATLFQIYGIEPTADGLVHYSDWSGSVLPEDLPENEAILQDTIRRCGQSTRTFRIRRRDDDECRFVESVETVRTNEQGQVEWVLGTNLDVTERNRSEQELRRLASELFNADRRKDEFLATLAHELRNPLAPIRNGLAILGHTHSPAQVDGLVKMMQRQLSHLVHLVDDLLDLSRVSRGKIELRRERVTMREIVRAAIEACQPSIDGKNHELVVEWQANSLEVEGDTTRLVQVVTNLLTNAAKYSEPNGRIRVVATHDRGLAVVEVIDTGVGIAPEWLPTLWDPFTQVRDTLDKAQGGLGIGLSLVKKLVELHGGTVTAQSDGVGCGSTFTIRLPLARVRVDATTTTNTRAIEGKPAQPQRRRVLVVDDNVDAADSLAMLLQFSGYETTTTYSGSDALVRVKSFRPEVVFLDIGLPQMDGYEVARRLRADPETNGTVLVALTGWGSGTDKQKSQEAGFDFHLTKPVDATAVHDILARPAQT